MSPKHTIEAVIFDNDGTLVDSESITLGVLLEMATEHGADVRDSDPERFVGVNLQIVFDEIAARAGVPVPDDFIDTFRSRQRAKIQSGLNEIPGATAVLTHLSAQKIPFAVASNAPRAKMDLCLEATGLNQFFPISHRTSAYEINSWKPSPDLFHHTAELLGVHPQNCAIVEDSPTGIEAGLATKGSVFAVDPDGRYEQHPNVVSLRRLDDLLNYI